MPTLWHTEEGGGGRRAEARDDNLHRMTLLARCSIHLPQALADALTSSKAILGRRLLQCSDLSKCIKVAGIKKCIGFEGPCNAIVSGITATWSAAVKVANDATKAVRKAADVAAAAATKAFNEMKDKLEEAAKAAAAAATKTLNEVKDAAEKAAATATKFIDDVKNAFSELGEEIQCAAPLPPEGRAPAVVARQWPRTPPAPLCGILAQRADVWNPVPLGRSVCDGVQELALDILTFSTKLFDTMLDVANNAIGAISDLAVKVAQEIGNALQLVDKGLCIAPSCRGPGALGRVPGHINSGDEEDLVEELDDLEILASQLRAHAYRFPLTQRTLEWPTHSPTHSPTHRQRIALTEYPCYAHWRRPCSRKPPRLWPMWQALTTVSVCFNVNEPELDLSGLGDAIKDFWLNNPAVKAPSRRLKLGFGAVLSASFDPTRPPQRPVEFRRPA
eukprot:scaffold3441_cov64-Phaeocystis_antarctica.AAC.1